LIAPPPIRMPDTAPKAELLRSLGKLVRGLSALFWGLPISLIVCVQTAQTQILHSLYVLPPMIVLSLLFYGLWLLGHFQRQERIWVAALDRAKILSLVNLGLGPFLFWWNQRPGEVFFVAIINVLGVTGLLFLSALNAVLCRLTAMLPDESLRQETRHFTSLNRFLLLGILLIDVLFFVLQRFSLHVDLPINLDEIFGPGGGWLVMFLGLLPLAMTMALIWKIKEIILDSVFGAD
jgi:hypothetical protein